MPDTFAVSHITNTYSRVDRGETVNTMRILDIYWPYIYIYIYMMLNSVHVIYIFIYVGYKLGRCGTDKQVVVQQQDKTAIAFPVLLLNGGNYENRASSGVTLVVWQGAMCGVVWCGV